MKLLGSILKWFLVIAFSLALLATIGVLSGLQWLTSSGLATVTIDGHALQFGAVLWWQWLLIASAVALAMMLVMILVPAAVIFALLVSGVAALIGLAAGVAGVALALSPVLLLALLLWWIVKKLAA